MKCEGSGGAGVKKADHVVAAMKCVSNGGAAV